MSYADNGSGLKARSSVDRLGKKSRVFELIAVEPDLSALELQKRAERAGLKLSLVSAYRHLRLYRLSGGRVEDTDTRCLRLIVGILQAAPAGDHVSAGEIEARARLQAQDVHRATIYRVLSRLESTGLVQSLARGRQKFYEWKREDSNHGHLTCMECGKTAEFGHQALDAFGQQICARLGYEFTGMEFTIRSLCGSCR